MNRVFDASQTRLSRSILDRATDRYSNRLVQGKLAVSFPEDRLIRIRALVNEIRIEVNRAEVLDGHHKQRLVGKIERLQGDLHKTASNLDAFWVLFGDAGVILGQFGTDVAPVVERIKEVATILRDSIADSLGAAPVSFEPPEAPVPPSEEPVQESQAAEVPTP